MKGRMPYLLGAPILATSPGDLQGFEIYNFKDGQAGKNWRNLILNTNPNPNPTPNISNDSNPNPDINFDPNRGLKCYQQSLS